MTDVIAWPARTSRGHRVEPPAFTSDNLRPPAPLDDPQRAERVAIGLIAYLDDMAALTRIRDATLRAMMDLSHDQQRDPGDEDDGIVGGEGCA